MQHIRTPEKQNDIKVYSEKQMTKNQKKVQIIRVNPK